MSNNLVRSLGGGRYLGWKAINSRGGASGILVFWDTHILQLLEVEEGVFLMLCHFKNYDEAFT